MEKRNNSRETAPTFLENFVQEVKSLTEEALSNPETKGYFELPSGMKTVREGNFPDYLRLETQTTIYVAEQLLEKLREEGRGTKEDFQNQKTAEKFTAFCKAQEPLLHLYAEAKDDPTLHELEEVYERRMKEFTADSSKE